MNPRCGKKNISKNDVEFDDDLQMVLCTGCYCLRHPGWIPPSQVEVMNLKAPDSDVGFKYDIQLNNRDGFTARVGVGEVSLSFHATPHQIHKLLGQG
jgi:hypothetical protein